MKGTQNTTDTRLQILVLILLRGRTREGAFAGNDFSPLADNEGGHSEGVPRRIEEAYRDDPPSNANGQPDAQLRSEPEEEVVQNGPSVQPSRLQESNEWR